MSGEKKVTVIELKETLELDERLIKFGKPVAASELKDVVYLGVSEAGRRAENCLGWIWRQWLSGNSRGAIKDRVTDIVRKGLELRHITKSYDDLALHDLYLINCAVLGCEDSLIKEVAMVIGDVSGDKGRKPSTNISSPRERGQTYLAAWSGMMKYWILGDTEKAIGQSQLIWEAYRNVTTKAAPKPLVTPWLNKDWSKFSLQQEKHFSQLWASARKDKAIVKSETDSEIVVTTNWFQIGHMWCWSHCALAILASREGAVVVTDPFWFPEVALK
jgi:hypothetical protein